MGDIVVVEWSECREVMDMAETGSTTPGSWLKPHLHPDVASVTHLTGGASSATLTPGQPILAVYTMSNFNWQEDIWYTH